MLFRSCRFDDFFESVIFQSPELSVPTTWQSLSRLTQGNTPTLWEHHKNTEEDSSGALVADDTQGKAHISIPSSNNFEKEECSQAPHQSTQEATVEDEPIARRTQGMI